MYSILHIQCKLLYALRKKRNKIIDSATTSTYYTEQRSHLNGSDSSDTQLYTILCVAMATADASWCFSIINNRVKEQYWKLEIKRKHDHNNK